VRLWAGKTVIEEVVEITAELMNAVELLLPQLSSIAPLPSQLEMEDIIASPRNALFIARDPDKNDEIVGMATLVIFRTPVGLQAWIEDVVVDQGARGKGFGAALTQACIQYAASAGAYGVNLTSRPARQAANRLYQRMGFVRRETNVYYYPLPPSPNPSPHTGEGESIG
jgi:ribosomal protein S18 acetylase RimI-like enzyme